MAGDLVLRTSSGSLIKELVLRTIGDELSCECAASHAVTKPLYASPNLLLLTRRCSARTPPMSLLQPSHAVANLRPTEYATMAFPYDRLLGDQLYIIQPLL